MCQIKQEYIKSLQQGGASKNTIVAYEKDIRKLFRLSGCTESEEISLLTTSDWYNVVNTLSETLKHSSVNAFLRNIGTFVRWLDRVHGVDSKAFDAMSFGRSKFLKVPRPSEDYLSSEEVQKILDVCTKDEKLMIAFMVYSGCRRGEVVGIKLEHIERAIVVQDDGTEKRVARIFLPQTKGDKPRYIPLTDEFVAGFDEYILGRKHQSEYLFIGKGTHEGMTSQAVFFRVKSLAKKAGFSDERVSSIHPHLFRHTAATNWASSGLSLNMIGKALGHANDAQVTRRYAHLREDAIQTVFSSQGGLLG